ncbi:hypothetical protein SVAN01_04930 [Stagonosporopsis vannaccii]|nr:hypothetical protein SVAN01_04930 [Stagonosporopsis vannaccii]
MSSDSTATIAELQTAELRIAKLENVVLLFTVLSLILFLCLVFSRSVSDRTDAILKQVERITGKIADSNDRNHQSKTHIEKLAIEKQEGQDLLLQLTQKIKEIDQELKDTHAGYKKLANYQERQAADDVAFKLKKQELEFQKLKKDLQYALSECKLENHKLKRENLKLRQQEEETQEQYAALRGKYLALPIELRKYKQTAHEDGENVQ